MSNEKPDEATEEHQAPFSDLMLKWLAEGDLQDEAAGKQGGRKNAGFAPRNAPAPAPQLRLTRWLGVSPDSRRQRVLLTGAALISVGLIVMVRRYSGHAEASDDTVAVTPSQPSSMPGIEEPVRKPEDPDRVELAASVEPPPSEVPAPRTVPAPPVPVAALPAPTAPLPNAKAANAPEGEPETVPADSPEALRQEPGPAALGKAPAPGPPGAPPSDVHMAAAAKVEPEARPSVPSEPRPQDPVPAEAAQRVEPAPPAPSAAPSESNVAATQDEPEARPSDSPEPRQEDALRDCRSAIAHENARDALKTCGVAASEAPDSPTAVVLFAKANLLVGRQGESLRLARRALTMDADLPDAYLLIGSVQQTTGHTQDARSAYETYLRLSPAGRYAAEVRAVLRTL